MEINYLILAHKNPKQLKRLIETLQVDHANFYIHIDKNTDIKPFLREIPKTENVRFIPLEKRKSTSWGDIGLVDATLTMIKEIIKDNRGGYCVLLSGQDYPLKNNAFIRRHLKENKGGNFMEIFLLPCNRWHQGGKQRLVDYKINLSSKGNDFILLPSVLDSSFFRSSILKNIIKALWRGKNPFHSKLLKRRVFPTYLDPSGGAQWWALPMETIKKVVSFLDKHPDYFEYHKDTLIADEIFFQSIVAHLFRDKPDLIKTPITYVNWEREDVPLPVTFTEADFDELQSLGNEYLFARKFDEKVDKKIFDLIDAELINNKTRQQSAHLH